MFKVSMKSVSFLAITLTLSLSVFAASNPIPDCLDGTKPLQVDNEQVIHWKHSTQNTFKARARTLGPITDIYPDHSGHRHFKVQLSSNPADSLEVVFNESFGAVPTLQKGMQVEACGDYITSIAPTGRYPASPDGAIIHWVHASPNEKRHPSGHLIIDGKLYGRRSPGSAPQP